MNHPKSDSKNTKSKTNTRENDNNTSETNFIRQAIEEDIASNRFDGRVHTRFPPEPSGYLHIGHAKAICISFGIAEDYDGLYNLRFDDSNPITEESEYVEAIKRDVHWLGFDWGEREFYASDFFETLYEYAVQLIEKEKAYVCDLTSDEMRTYRGTLVAPGKDSPYRNRSVEENLTLFGGMRNGEFPDGSRTLRAKIDMSSPNLNMRDPVMYRILRAHHYRHGDNWCIYPTYDFTHGQSDSIEGVTHSLCDVQFEDHRPLYDWFLESLEIYQPRQIEFARLNLTYTVLGKRKLKVLVEEGHVDGWDDPRLPTLAGMRRRGYTPESIRDFCNRIGVSKADNLIEIGQLEYSIRGDLNKRAPRVMAVLNPIKVIIDNYPERQVEMLDADNNPEDENAGTRQIPFSREIYIEREDFMEDPPRKFYRLAPGREVRLKHAYYITCESVVKDENTGKIVEIHCTYDPKTRGGWSDDGRRVQGTLHWVSAEHAVNAEVRLYESLFTEREPENTADGNDWIQFINPDSLEILNNCKVEPSLVDAPPESRYQFLRMGYFCVDSDTTPEKLVFNRTVPLRDSWAKIQKGQK
ncbi:MAG: glutamine--tRNA ligase/YqeY domain fusion protein [Candidatus Poribacteria bacterium]|nr:glutamine--tRNA ligase/YqeY domain fusion protein [Candidatus Poribacteria bacterium]